MLLGMVLTIAFLTMLCYGKGIRITSPKLKPTINRGFPLKGVSNNEPSYVFISMNIGCFNDYITIYGLKSNKQSSKLPVDATGKL